MATKIDIGKAITILYENYRRAQDSTIIKRPISYALYTTWKYVDAIEKPRVLMNRKVDEENVDRDYQEQSR